MKNIVIFVSGAAIGSVVTWKLLEKKYKDLADEEIASVIETFKNRKDTKIKKVNNREKEEDSATIPETIDTMNYNHIVKEEYVNEEIDDTIVDIDMPEEEVLNIYLIAPENFGEKIEYGTKSLTYYADGVITDEINEPIPNFDEIIGNHFLDHFGDYEDDSVYIRDDTNEMDYEILKSDSMYNSENVGDRL